MSLTEYLLSAIVIELALITIQMANIHQVLMKLGKLHSDYALMVAEYLKVRLADSEMARLAGMFTGLFGKKEKPDGNKVG